MNFFVFILNDFFVEVKIVEIDKEIEQVVIVGQFVNIIVDKINGVNVLLENKENERKGEKMCEGEIIERGNCVIFFDKISKCFKIKVFFDEISEQFKIIDIFQLFILCLKVDKVFRCIDDVIFNDVDIRELLIVN